LSPAHKAGFFFLCTLDYIDTISMDISPILQELSTMKYDLISVRSSRQIYKVSRPVDVYAALKCYANAKVESFYAVLLDNAHNIMSVKLITVGLTNRTLVHPREVYRPAILASAVAVIVSHNHPGGSNTASPEDIEITRRLREAGELLGIPLLDHIIISGNILLVYGRPVLRAARPIIVATRLRLRAPSLPMDQRHG
jgi:DNA repair protein RadC